MRYGIKWEGDPRPPTPDYSTFRAARKAAEWVDPDWPAELRTRRSYRIAEFNSAGEITGFTRVRLGNVTVA